MNLVVHYIPGEAFLHVLEWELDDDPVEMTNLAEEDTGVPGTIYVSTRQGRHGPRVKWYPGRAGADKPFLTITLEDPPRMINHGVAPRAASGAVAAAAWATSNRTALLRFWTQGVSYTRAELNAFMDGLEKLD